VPQQIGADRVNAGSATEGIQAYKGKDVVVGIVDAGFDYVNPFFRDAQGKTRIQWAADYVANKTYNGSEAVVAAMHSSDAATMLHGTHVAGIAAGSRVNDINDVFYQGIAPEADIAEGAINSEISSSGLNSSQAIKAFSDIFDYAKTQQKPCVINFSMGDAMSFVDSRQLEEEAIRTLLSEPGRALVVASGNAGGTSRFAHKEATLTEGGAGVWFNEDEQYGTYFGIEVKMLPTQTLQLRYMDSTYKTNKGEVSMSGTELASQTTLTMGSKRLTVQYRGKTGDGYDVIYITAGLASFATSERVLVTIKGEGDAWIYADALCAQLENVPAQYVANHALAQDGYSMTWPAMHPDVVTVGNIAHRFKILTAANKQSGKGPTDITEYESTKGEGYLAKSSSVGPTLTGLMKPDVCAPGVNVVSAQNFFIDDDTYFATAAWDICTLDTEYETWGGLSGYFHMMAQTGTSMSAPVVTGVIALWMQADPTLTTDKIKEIIAKSSRQPDDTMTYPNNQYGYGEIDAYEGLKYIESLTGIENITNDSSSKREGRGYYTLDGRRLANQPTAKGLYIVNGKKVILK
jgi:subtilisin family serine protease